tara:strand:+ start:549 stop:1190 length:642 start_codon:yes stop_codon:yes gene_type:complete
MFRIINFKSKPKNNPFAPEWNNYIVEEVLNNINIQKLTTFLQKKEKDILKLKKSNDGFTGLKNHTTTRHKEYNIFNFKNTEITKLKKQIVKVHNKLLKKLNMKPVKSLYIKGWFNIMRENEFIRPHAHGWHEDTYLGGHFCVQCNNTSTYYINPINQLCKPAVYKSKNKKGKLTLFQNFIPHYTDIHKGKNKRITIAFDTCIIPMTEKSIKII